MPKKREIKIAKKIFFKLIHGLFKRDELSSEKIRNIKPEKILIIRQDKRIGNLLFITPIISKLRELFPDSQLDVVVCSRYNEIIESNPKVNHIKNFPHEKWWLTIRFLRELRKTNYDITIDCKREFSFTNASVSTFCKSKIKIGFVHDYSSGIYDYACILPSEDKKNLHEIDLLIKPLKDIWGDFETPRMEYYIPKDKRIKHDTKFLIAFHIGGHGIKKPPVDVINKIIQLFNDPNIQINIIYGPEEKEKVEQVMNQPNVVKILPENINHLAAIIDSSDILFCPDTGALHIGSALNKPIINLLRTELKTNYAPKSDNFWVVNWQNEDYLKKIRDVFTQDGEGVLFKEPA